MAVDRRLNLHHIEPVSSANGPGLRTVLWFQGCTLGCPGCFNPATHPHSGGRFYQPEVLLQTILEHKERVEGVTISGGEPLQQITGLISFLQLIRQNTSLSVVLFSGYAWEEIQKMPLSSQVFKHVDILLAGRFIQEQRCASRLLGSANKTVHFLTDRYTPADIVELPEAEIIIQPDGSLHFSGIDPLQW